MTRTQITKKFELHSFLVSSFVFLVHVFTDLLLWCTAVAASLFQTFAEMMHFGAYVRRGKIKNEITILTHKPKAWTKLAQNAFCPVPNVSVCHVFSFFLSFLLCFFNVLRSFYLFRSLCTMYGAEGVHGDGITHSFVSLSIEAYNLCDYDNVQAIPPQEC